MAKVGAWCQEGERGPGQRGLLPAPGRQGRALLLRPSAGQWGPTQGLGSACRCQSRWQRHPVARHSSHPQRMLTLWAGPWEAPACLKIS